MDPQLSLIQEVFPFHIKTDRDLTIQSLGASCNKLLNERCIGEHLMECMPMVSPRAPLSPEKVERYRNTTLLCREKESNVL